MEDNSLIIIPTYNESENIELIINKILHLDDSNDILVVDDNSPDGTSEIVSGLKENFVNKDQKSLHFFSQRNKNIYLNCL